MTVTVTLEELRDYEDKMLLWHSKRFSIVMKAIERTGGYTLDKENLMHSVKSALDAFAEKPPRISDQL